MRWLFFILIYMNALIVNAQLKSKVDSLLIEYKKIKANDNIDKKAILLYQIIEQNINVNNSIPEAQKNWVSLDSISKINNSPNIKLRLNLSKSLILLNKSNYLDCNSHAFEALKYAEKLNSWQFIGECYAILAVSHRKLNKIQEAINYYKIAISFFEKSNLSRKVALNLNNLGLAFYYSNQLDSSLIYYDRSFKIYDKLGFNLGKAYSYENKGTTYAKQGKYQLAIQNLKQAGNYYDKYGTPALICQNRLNLGRAFYETKNYTYSLSLLQEAEKLAEKYKLDIWMLEIYKMKFEIEKKLGDFKNATYTAEKIDIYTKLANDETLEKKLKDTKLSYELDKQQTLTELQKSKIKSQENEKKYLIIGLMIVFVFAIILAFAYSRIQNQAKKIKAQNLTILEKSNKLELLNDNLEIKVVERTKELSDANTQLENKNREITYAQLEGQTIERTRIASELHDNLGGYITALNWSFSALGNSLIFNEKESKLYDKIKSMIEEAYQQVRDLSHNLIPEELNNKGLNDAFLKLFSNLNLNQNKVFIYKSNLTNRIEKKLEFELYSITLELINNIIKHSKAKRVEITLKNDNGLIELSIIDDGILFDWNADINKGKGLASIKQRVLNLGGDLITKNLLLSDNSNLNHFKCKFTV